MVGFKKHDDIYGSLIKSLCQGIPSGWKYQLKALKHSKKASFQLMSGDALIVLGHFPLFRFSLPLHPLYIQDSTAMPSFRFLEEEEC